VELDRRQRQRERNPIAGEARPQIRIGQHRPHARQRARLHRIDALQHTVRDRAANERGVK
jgi:hypothetical protein